MGKADMDSDYRYYPYLPSCQLLTYLYNVQGAGLSKGRNICLFVR